jgi:hypothetical protein
VDQARRAYADLPEDLRISRGRPRKIASNNSQENSAKRLPGDYLCDQ